jgi:hypothetical protein
MNDDELKDALRTWRPGEPAVSLREESIWRRLWRAELRVPLPVAAAAVVLLVVAALAFGRPDNSAPQQALPLEGFEPVSDLNARVVSDAGSVTGTQGGDDVAR